ncbi:MAG: hypothetical protein ABIL15_01435 [candidate division WOR-3 bacterium]
MLAGFPRAKRTDLKPLHHIPAHIKELISTISPATIEQLLKPIKDQYNLPIGIVPIPVLRTGLKCGLRSRPYHKNDNPVVESRNFTLVRAHVGYRRYDTDAEYEILAELCPLLSMLHNYFMPTMMLVKKVRVGGKVYRTYNIDTPYNRVLNSPDVSEEKKQMLRERKAALSYPELLQRILERFLSFSTGE